jgi:hypothetical protein
VTDAPGPGGEHGVLLEDGEVAVAVEIEFTESVTYRLPAVVAVPQAIAADPQAIASHLAANEEDWIDHFHAIDHFASVNERNVDEVRLTAKPD